MSLQKRISLTLMLSLSLSFVEPLLISEYRIPLPLSMDEFRLAQLYSTTKASKLETGGGEGFEIIESRPFTDPQIRIMCNGVEYTSGWYTHKLIHLSSKLPQTLRMLAPKGSTEIHEKSWNAYPCVRTEYSNPDYMKEAFVMTIQTMYLADSCTTENVHNLPADLLAQRRINDVDIVNDPVPPADYNEAEDPSKCSATGAGPLTTNWKDAADTVMCAYKLVSIKFQWWGIQDTMERVIQNAERRIFTKFHRQLFCWMDEWSGLTLEQIREIEEQSATELNDLRATGEVTGMKVF